MQDFVGITWLRLTVASSAAVLTFLNFVADTNAFQASQIKPQIATVAKAIAENSIPESRVVDPAQKPTGPSDPSSTTQQVTPQNDPATNEPLTKLHLQDGSIIRGQLATNSIKIATEFGILTVPVSRILELRPGLKHRPEFSERIDALVKQLASTDKGKRGQATNKLISQGASVLSILKLKIAQTTGKQRDTLKQIIDEILTIQEDEGSGTRIVQLVADDVIVTPDFSIVGDIQTQNFNVKSKFGDLNVTLADIQFASRRTRSVAEPIRKSVSVPAMAFFQTTPHSTKIRVKRGDRVEIKATGSVNWTNWSMTSSPQGVSNRGSWRGFNSGMLVARIGSSGNRYQRIGSGQSFVAKSSGVLYLGVAMRDSYATNGGYSWTGQYNAKILVTPAGDN